VRRRRLPVCLAAAAEIQQPRHCKGVRGAVHAEGGVPVASAARSIKQRRRLLTDDIVLGIYREIKEGNFCRCCRLAPIQTHAVIMVTIIYRLFHSFEIFTPPKPGALKHGLPMSLVDS
jgi:hypothetical protein